MWNLELSGLDLLVSGDVSEKWCGFISIFSGVGYRGRRYGNMLLGMFCSVWYFCMV